MYKVEPVASSVIAGLGFDPEFKEPQTVDVVWNRGGKTPYYNVPFEVIQDWLNADSVGVFYNANIKKNSVYAGEPAPEPTSTEPIF
jgi:hypothetical protein